jgi:hypothetical protein
MVARCNARRECDLGLDGRRLSNSVGVLIDEAAFERSLQARWAGLADAGAAGRCRAATREMNHRPRRLGARRQGIRATLGARRLAGNAASSPLIDAM